MTLIKAIVTRLEAVLEEMDSLATDCGSPEALEDLNAEFEDSLVMLSEISPRDEDWQEELSDALEDLRALAGDYRKLAGAIPGVEALALRLEQAARA